MAVAIWLLTAVSAAAQVQTTHDQAILLRDAAGALEVGDIAGYDLATELLLTEDDGLPSGVIEALSTRDGAFLTLGANLIEASDGELYLWAADVIVREQALLPDRPPEFGSKDERPPLPTDAPEMRRVDNEGLAVLELLDHRMLDVPTVVRLVLEIAPRPGSAVEVARPVDYEAARRELQQYTLANSATGGTVSTRTLLWAASAAAATIVAIGVARRRMHSRLVNLAMTDGLTGLKNRRKLDIDFDTQRRTGTGPTALLMIDVDNFKAFNDAHGHASGDEALRRVGKAIADSMRSGDVPYRYGGEEFCVLLPGTDDTSAEVIAERIRNTIGEIDLGLSAVTASVGVATGPARDVVATAAAADKALYKAKTSGRNQVAVAERLSKV